MRKKWIIILMILMLLVGSALFIYKRWISSPEYAVLKIVKDVRERELDGLLPHLTDDAAEKVNSVMAVAQNPIVSGIASLLADDHTAVLREHLSSIEWSLEDILKGEHETIILLSFYYSEAISGTIRLYMIQEDNEWKIHRLDTPIFQ